MKRLTMYHFNLINHFNPAEIAPGFWYDYVTRLGNKEARLLFKKCQYNSLKLVHKPKRSDAVKVMQEQIRSVKHSCKKQTRSKYASSPQVTRKDKKTKRTRFNVIA